MFSSDLWFIEQLAERVVFLNPNDGQFVENQLRWWYHKLLPFLKPSPAQVLQLSFDGMQHSWIMKESEDGLNGINHKDAKSQEDQWVSLKQ